MPIKYTIEDKQLISHKFQHIVDKYIGNLADVRDAFGYESIKPISAFTKSYSPDTLKKVLC